MKTRIALAFAATVLAATVATGAHAGHDDRRAGRYGRGAGDDYARVLHVTPLVERVRRMEPVEICHLEPRHRSGGRTQATLTGGLLGAVIGNQFGSGDGRGAATIAGAVIGGAIAREASSRDRRGFDDYGRDAVERCEVRHEPRLVEEVRAYRVAYRYRGRDYVTELPYDPGPRLRVAVEARPL